MKRSILALSLLGAGFAAGPALADVSNLQRALGHLQEARNDLEQGGKGKEHQKEALQLVGQAIEHVRKGIDQEQKKQQKSTEQEQKRQEKATKQEQESLEKTKQQEQKSLDKAKKQELKSQEKTTQQEQKKTTN
jgi:hypothetical protein